MKIRALLTAVLLVLGVPIAGERKPTIFAASPIDARRLEEERRDVSFGVVSNLMGGKILDKSARLALPRRNGA